MGLQMRSKLTTGARPTGHHGCHNDGNPNNNKLSNLRWATPKENALDRIRHGNGGAGEKNTQSKLTDQQVAAIRLLHKAGCRQCDLVKTFGVCKEMVRRIVKRLAWRHVA